MDAELLPEIRRLVDQRPTYGYRRLTALLNRERRTAGLEPVNRKRVLRILGQHGLTLQRSTGRREGRVHDGKVAVMTSNLRWCSDALEIGFWNGERIRIAFIVDAFDREIIAHVAIAGAGISGSDVRDMMLAAVERRFGRDRAPHGVEHLSDNGSCYTAKETRDFATALGFVPCFTPVRSPESNGMSEFFVRTLKRDYVCVTPLPDAATVLRLVARWIDDYNTVHPHSALRHALACRVPRRAQPQPGCPVKQGALPSLKPKDREGRRSNDPLLTLAILTYRLQQSDVVASGRMDPPSARHLACRTMRLGPIETSQTCGRIRGGGGTISPRSSRRHK